MSLVSVFTAVFLVACLVVAARRLPALHPVVLWCASWAAVGTLFALDLLPYKPLSLTTAALVCGGTVAFAAGALFGERQAGKLLRRLVQPRDDAATTKVIERAALTALAIACVGMVAFVIQTSRTFGLGDVLLVRAEVRLGLGAGASGLTIKYLYASIAAIALCGLAAAGQDDRSRRRMWLGLAAIGVATIYFATGRSTIVIATAIGIASFWIGRGTAPSGRRVAAVAGGLAALAVVTMLAIGELQGKTFGGSDIGRIQSTFSENAAIQPLGLPYLYASASFGALDEQVSHTTAWGVSDGCATASGVCSVLAAAGADTEAVPFIRPFTAAPLRWNLYTALDLPLLDGGLAGVLPIVLLVGVGFGAIWAAARRRTLAGLVAYSIAGPTLLFSGNQFGFLTPQVVGGALLALGLVGAWALAPRLLRRQRPASTSL